MTARPERRPPDPAAAAADDQPGRRPRRVPVSTYRLQIHGDFPLSAATELVVYLDRLGVGDLYTSPLTTSRRGSPHGYDVTDPTRIDPEIGGEEALAELSVALRERGMGLLLDIVPNHMAASTENPWWQDVLRHGRDSPHARFFDIDWESASVGRGRLLLPVLGGLYGDELEAGNLRLVGGEDGPELAYHGLRLPLAPGTFEGDDLEAVNADSQALDRVVAAQHYRPAVWRLAGEAVNYRRFFDISELAALRAEDEEVFRASHGLILRLLREGIVSGLRVDHVDGLADPRRYLERLQQAAAGGDEGPLYVVVEKILAADESLPEEWPVAGTTGYESLNSLTGLFVEPHGLLALDRLYARTTGLTDEFEEVRYRRKKQALEELFPGEVGALARRLERLAAGDLRARDVPFSELHRALVEVSACLRVYRTYADECRATGGDGPDFVGEALAEARRRAPGGPLTGAAYDFLASVLRLEGGVDPAEQARRLAFVSRWQQLTGPAMAKGLEDTALYVYNRLISLNAVGGEPEGVDPPGDSEAYHHRNAERRRAWPYSLTASMTHDAKRSEDVRARVNVLSELAGEWERRVERWAGMNRGRKRAVGGALVPDANEEIFLYQTLVGAWPLRDAAEARFAERLEEYLVKAAREAKVHTSWLAPDDDWESALIAFVRDLLDERGANPFLDDLLGFQPLVAFYGAFSSLSQVVLQLAAPGVPDTYQGTELWNFSLVDPDNRRPVDWPLRRRLLDELADREREDRRALLAELVERWRDGRIKLWTTWKALVARRRDPDLFLLGSYRPLAAEGALARHVVAFARRRDERWLVAAVPRWLSAVVAAEEPPIGEVWDDLELPLPEGSPTEWRDVLSGEAVEAEARSPSVASSLASRPPCWSPDLSRSRSSVRPRRRPRRCRRHRPSCR
ncbi:MAG TPA: malto-oligosyltrehalose synthase [Thermoanaerobaculia bacterium]|nr:malto-oligosyltrehalose synthase [Thermoanaerobaculia bacterium]